MIPYSLSLAHPLLPAINHAKRLDGKPQPKFRFQTTKSAQANQMLKLQRAPDCEVYFTSSSTQNLPTTYLPQEKSSSGMKEQHLAGTSKLGKCIELAGKSTQCAPQPSPLQNSTHLISQQSIVTMTPQCHADRLGRAAIAR